MLIFPVRHHSPAAALHLRRLIQERRPRLILIEGPADADGLIPHLLDPGTRPPVAVYAYRTDVGRDAQRARSVSYPFCDYSPEYVALAEGRRAGAEVRFCDVPSAVTLRWQEPDETPPPVEPDPFAAFAERLRQSSPFDTFEGWWEATIEQGLAGAATDEYIAVMRDYGGKVRDLDPRGRRDDRDRLREAHMAAYAASAVAGGTSAEEILVVCGAAHAEAIAAMAAAGITPPELPEPAPVALALIPFSFPRLSEQLGYGAGNRAPWFFQQVWQAEGDFALAARRALAAAAGRLRDDGRLASLAQVIDGDRLASTLAQMRGKRAPGVDEVSDAAVACLGQGQPEAVERAIAGVLIGEAIGRVTPRAGRTSLQSEFYEETQRLRLPVTDAPRQILVHLPVAAEAEQSVLLHRLVTAEIPFAHELESGIRGRGRAAQGGPLEQLARAREKWEICWTPATDARLVEQSAWGSTLAEVTERILRERLSRADRVDEGTATLLRLAVCDVLTGFPAALARCETLAADSASFPALARATYHLDGLLAYGAARRLPVDHLDDLAGRLFVRAALHLPAAARCGDEDADAVEQTLLPLTELARRSPRAGADLLWQRLATLAEMPNAHPRLRGIALTVLQVNDRLAPPSLGVRLRTALSRRDPAHDAHLISGLFAVHRATLIRNREIMGAVTDFLTALPIERLIPLLPALRRGLGNLSPAERAYLTETLGAVLGLQNDKPAGLPSLDDLERARLLEIDRDVAAMLAEWSDRYGIA